MFATLLGALPRPPRAFTLDDEVVAAIRAQEEAGLEPLTDGRRRDPGSDALIDGLAGRATPVDPVAWWSFAAASTSRAVKQALPGPYSIGWIAARAGDGAGRNAAVHAAAAGLHTIVRTLADRGCPLIEIEETEAHRIGDDDSERALFREAHRIVTEDVRGTHLSLSIVGGPAAGAGVETILDAPYASLAVDLIQGPDNWNLVTRAAGDRGIVAGALAAREHGDEPKEVLLWAAHYAASTGGRGLARAGLGSAGSYASLPWAVAVRKMRLLGTVARLAELPPSEELTEALDPRAISARRAALGRHAPARPRRC